MEPYRVIVIGGGLRGRTYADIMLTMPEKFKVVGIAEPIEDRRRYFAETFDIPAENCFEDWRPLLAKGKIADVAIIATMDRDHFEPSVEAINLGYHLLLEKPISPVPAESIRVAQLAEEKGVHVLVCHVLRFTPFFVRLKQLIDDGAIGDLQSIVHSEYVGNVHQSHSFVRGNWCDSEKSSPMILQKSCHDMDILQWLVGRECRYVQSFGSLSYFCEKYKPEGAADRCIDCSVRDNCPYNAIELYPAEEGWFPCAATKKIHPTKEDIDLALRESDYGRCVFSSDNNVVDHQVVNLEFEDGITVAFTMAAFNKGGREMKIMGTKGEITAKMSETTMELYSFDTKETTEVPILDAQAGDNILNGHGGGDNGIVNALYELLSGTYHGNNICDAMRSAENHIIAYAAEESRKNHQTVNMKDFRSDIYANL